MTKIRRPYSRLYWEAIDDEKFRHVWTDDAALACWTRLLIAADMAWPASASLYYGIKKKALDVLVKAGLVDLAAGDRYRIHGLEKERNQRSEWGRDAALTRHSRDADGMRPQPSGTANGMRPHPNGNAEGMPSRAEQSRDIDIVSTTPPGYKSTRSRLGVVTDPEGTH